MRRVTLGVIALALLAGAYIPAGAEPKVEKTVNCVYPGEVLASALTDFAGQLGYSFELPVDESEYSVDGILWVHAKNISPSMAATLIGASGGVRVTVDDANRQVLVAARDEDLTTASNSVRSFRVDALCKLLTDYQKRYGEKSSGFAQGIEYRPPAAEELREAVYEILQQGDSPPGSAVGKRLVYTGADTELARIDELLNLLQTGGDSSELSIDRANREKLRGVRSNFGGAGTMVSSMLWNLFKDCDVPVYIDEQELQAFDFEYDTTAVTLRQTGNHYEGLLALAREQGFFVDSKHGALRLHEDFFVGSSSYRVFDVAEMLEELEKEYADLKTGEDVEEGFHGDLRTEGGVQVIVDALSLQLENAGFTPLIRAYGPRIAVAGGIDVVDRAFEILEALGMKSDGVTDGDSK